MQRGRTAAGWTAIGAAAVYVALQGNRVGAVHPGGWGVDDLVTGGLAVAGIGVALAAIRLRGTRVPRWLVAVQLWVGAGLLAPFVLLMPAAAALRATGRHQQPRLWPFVSAHGGVVVLGGALAVVLTVALLRYAAAASRHTKTPQPRNAR